MKKKEVTNSNIHEGCGGIIVFFSSFTETHDVETPVCTKCGAQGKQIRTEVK